MSVFTIFIIVVAGVAVVWGFIQGLMRQLASIAGIILGIIACRIFGAQVADWLAAFAEEGASKAILIVIAYVLTFAAAYLVAALVGMLARKTLKAVQLGFVDRLSGALFKAFLWMFILSLLLNVWCAIAPEYTPSGIWAQRVMWLAPAFLGSETAAELKNALAAEAWINIIPTQLVDIRQTIS